MFGSNPHFRVLNENLKGRDFFVGDIHGHYTLLVQSLKAIEFNTAEDRLISVGDLVDRGPESPECIDLLNAPWFEACMGNHEWMLLAGTLESDANYREMQLRNGGGWIQQVSHEQLCAWSRLIRSRCPLAIEVKFGSRRIGVTHNDVLGNDWRLMKKKASEKNIDRCVWSRTRFTATLDNPDRIESIKGIDVVVSGHNPHPVPVWAKNQLYIDTLWKGNYLTILSAEDLFVMAAS